MMVGACNLSISVSEFHTQKKKSFMNNNSCCTTVVKDAGSSLWKGTLRSARSRCSTDTVSFLDSDTRFLVWASEPGSPPPPRPTHTPVTHSFWWLAGLVLGLSEQSRLYS